MPAGAGLGSSVGLTLELNSDVIAEILSVTRTMPSWKACQMEGTDWTGTTEDNTQQYISIGVEGLSAFLDFYPVGPRRSWMPAYRILEIRWLVGRPAVI